MNTELKGIDRLIKILKLSIFLKNDQKEEFYNTIGQYIFDDGLNRLYINLLEQAHNRWYKEIQNEDVK